MQREYLSVIQSNVNITKQFKEKLLSLKCFDCERADAIEFDISTGEALCEFCANRKRIQSANIGQLNINIDQLRHRVSSVQEQVRLLQSVIKKVEDLQQQLFQVKSEAKNLILQLMKNQQERLQFAGLFQDLVKSKMAFCRAGLRVQFAREITKMYRLKQEFKAKEQSVNNYKKCLVQFESPLQSTFRLMRWSTQQIRQVTNAAKGIQSIVKKKKQILQKSKDQNKNQKKQAQFSQPAAATQAVSKRVIA